MPTKCIGARGCSAFVPSELEAQNLCVLHFLRKIEDACNDLRREMALGLSRERNEQILARIAEFGEQLIHLSLNGERLTNELKMGILNGVLALINLRESMNQMAARQASLLKASGA